MTQEQKNKLTSLLIEYYCNIITSEQVLLLSGITPTAELEQIIALSQKSWESVVADGESPTADNYNRLDDIIDNTIDDIINSI